MKNLIIIIFLLLGLQSATSIYAYAPASQCINVRGSVFLENNEKGSSISDEMKPEPDAGAFHEKKKKIGLFNKLKQKLVRFGLKLIQNEGKDDRPFHWSAITALVCGALTLVSAFLFLPAIVFGAIGIAKTGPNKQYKGLGMSIAGLGLGALIGLIFFILYFILFASFA